MASAQGQEFPKTEEGFQALLAALEKARVAKDETEEARLLLRLSFLVKWVRSDNDQDPFSRSFELANQALLIYRKLDDRKGIISALLDCASPFDRTRAMQMIDEAEQLARRAGDEFELAQVLTKKSSLIGLGDRGGGQEAIPRSPRDLRAAEKCGWDRTSLLLPRHPGDG